MIVKLENNSTAEILKTVKEFAKLMSVCNIETDNEYGYGALTKNILGNSEYLEAILSADEENVRLDSNGGYVIPYVFKAELENTETQSQAEFETGVWLYSHYGYSEDEKKIIGRTTEIRKSFTKMQVNYHQEDVREYIRSEMSEKGYGDEWEIKNYTDEAATTARRVSISGIQIKKKTKPTQMVVCKMGKLLTAEFGDKTEYYYLPNLSCMTFGH